jgi:hypothetical protein
MTVISCVFLSLALVFQSINLGVFVRELAYKKRASQILLVPVVFWYVGVLIKGSGAIFDSAGLGVLIFFAIHLACVLMSVPIEYFSSKPR